MPAFDRELLTLLVNRLREARAKGALMRVLKAGREEQGLPRRAFRSTGNMEELSEAVLSAAELGAVTVDTLARQVDVVEENGGQHIFLFDLTPDGVEAVRAPKFSRAFPRLPERPTHAMYAELPSATRTYFVTRGTTSVVKQIFRGSYWEKDSDRSRATDDERTTVFVRRDRRAINLLLVDPVQRQAEIRIDRVRGQMDDSLATELFTEFKDVLGSAFDFEKCLIPTPIWNGFSTIVRDRQTTYMSTDSAQDASVSVQISNRRASDRGKDVRDHSSYRYETAEYSRNSVNIYWLMDDSETKIHTILSRVDIAGDIYAKVYVSAKVEEDELRNVIERIRRFARSAP